MVNIIGNGEISKGVQKISESGVRFEKKDIVEDAIKGVKNYLTSELQGKEKDQLLANIIDELYISSDNFAGVSGDEEEVSDRIIADVLYFGMRESATPEAMGALASGSKKEIKKLFSDSVSDEVIEGIRNNYVTNEWLHGIVDKYDETETTVENLDNEIEELNNLKLSLTEDDLGEADMVLRYVENKKQSLLDGQMEGRVEIIDNKPDLPWVDDLTKYLIGIGGSEGNNEVLSSDTSQGEKLANDFKEGVIEVGDSGETGLGDSAVGSMDDANNLGTEYNSEDIVNEEGPKVTNDTEEGVIEAGDSGETGLGDSAVGSMDDANNLGTEYNSEDIVNEEGPKVKELREMINEVIKGGGLAGWGDLDQYFQVRNINFIGTAKSALENGRLKGPGGHYKLFEDNNKYYMVPIDLMFLSEPSMLHKDYGGEYKIPELNNDGDFYEIQKFAEYKKISDDNYDLVEKGVIEKNNSSNSNVDVRLENNLTDHSNKDGGETKLKNGVTNFSNEFNDDGSGKKVVEKGGERKEDQGNISYVDVRLENNLTDHSNKDGGETKLKNGVTNFSNEFNNDISGNKQAEQGGEKKGDQGNISYVDVPREAFVKDGGLKGEGYGYKILDSSYRLVATKGDSNGVKSSTYEFINDGSGNKQVEQGKEKKGNFLRKMWNSLRGR